MAVLGPSKHTKCERVVRMFLVRRKERHSLHADLPGTPDVYIHRLRLCVFVDGRFWHDPNGRTKRMSRFWRDKVKKNFMRDRKNRRRLQRLNLRTVTIWDDGLPRGLKRLEKLLIDL